MNEPQLGGSRPDPFSYWGVAAIVAVLLSAMWLALEILAGALFFVGADSVVGPLILGVVALGLAAKARAEARARSGRSLAWAVTLTWTVALALGQVALLATPSRHWPFG